jgi:myo-inositol-1(or 4)-monophosphatase
MQRMLSLAADAARVGGDALRARVADYGEVRHKATATDFVTDADVQAGVAVAQTISSVIEGARFVIEEDEVYSLAGVAEGDLADDEVWVIDPLDGTASYVHGYPFYSVSVALMSNGTPIVGAVYNVPADEMFTAAQGLGAHFDDEPAACTATARLEDAMLVTGFPYDRGALFDRQHAILGRLMRLPIHGIRRDGSAALDCTHVATGRVDGFWEFGLKAWDTAAGVVICREAGALVTGIDGEPWTPHSGGIIAANPTLHAAILEVVRDTPHSRER